MVLARSAESTWTFYPRECMGSWSGGTNGMSGETCMGRARGVSLASLSRLAKGHRSHHFPTPVPQSETRSWRLLQHPLGDVTGTCFG